MDEIASACAPGLSCERKCLSVVSGSPSSACVRTRFAANLRAARERKEFSQEELRGAPRLHRTEVSLLERSGREPRLETMVRLAHALEIPVAELVRGVDTASESG